MKPSGLSDSPFFSPPVAQTNGQDNPYESVLPCQHATMVEALRKAVKTTGKEAATYRFTKSEKQALMDIIYSYRRKNIKVSENEIARIAVNYIIQDHQNNPENSLLQEVLNALNQ